MKSYVFFDSIGRKTRRNHAFISVTGKSGNIYFNWKVLADVFGMDEGSTFDVAIGFRMDSDRPTDVELVIKKSDDFPKDKCFRVSRRYAPYNFHGHAMNSKRMSDLILGAFGKEQNGGTVHFMYRGVDRILEGGFEAWFS